MTEELHAYAGRQALFDRRLTVVGYELLVRDRGAEPPAAATMLEAFVELGLDALARTLPVWVSLPAELLFGKRPMPLPPERTVIQVLEDVSVTPALLAALQGFRARGFKIALGDFVLTPATRPLLDLAWAVKVDVSNLPKDEIASQLAELKPTGAVLVAEKISTHEEHMFLRDLGFYLFQGHFLEQPILAKARRSPHDRAALVAILGALYAPKLDLREVEARLAAEVGLGTRLFKLARSPAILLGQPVSSVRQAVQQLGAHQVAALVVLAMVAGFDDKPLELARQALVRARMCEALAGYARLPRDQLFTAGLLSLLDAVLDRPLYELLSQLPLGPLVRDALAGGDSTAAQILDTVRHQSRGELVTVRAAAFPAQTVFLAWFEAIRWADAVIAKI